jgi:proteasome assembly chaperone (PAC2) family protein
MLSVPSGEMQHVRWKRRPALQGPVVIAAFEGWNDAGDAASTAARWLRDRWAPEVVAELDCEDFFDFTSARPTVRLDGDVRKIDWPVTQISAGDGAGVDTVVVLGHEPQLRWRTFSEQLVDVCREVDASMVVTLGALLAEVPHTKPTQVMGTAVDQATVDRLGLTRSRYEGPTGIVGVVQDAVHTAGIPTASLWAAVSAYVPGAPSPKAALALVQRAAELLTVPVDVTDLQVASAAYERQVSEVVVDDEEMTEYVARLEERWDDDQTDPSPASLVEEVERFLRDQPPGHA